MNWGWHPAQSHSDAEDYRAYLWFGRPVPTARLRQPLPTLVRREATGQTLGLLCGIGKWVYDGKHWPPQSVGCGHPACLCANCDEPGDLRPATQDEKTAWRREQRRLAEIAAIEANRDY